MTHGVPLHGAAFILPGMEAGSADLAWAEVQWDADLPPDFRRVAPEVHRPARNVGQRSVRSWMACPFRGDRGCDICQGIWQQAALVDRTPGKAETALEALRILGMSDALNVALRRLSFYVPELRMGDKVAVRAMLDVSLAGSARDQAPAWLVRQVADHSETEVRTRDRVRVRIRGSRAPDAANGDKGDANGAAQRLWRTRQPLCSRAA